MFPNRRALVGLLATAAMASSLVLSGCGTRVGSTGDPNEKEPPAPTQPAPAPSADPGSPSPGLPSPGQPAPGAKLLVSQKIFKTELLGWFSKPYIEVMVTNPGQSTLSGTLTINFTKKGESTGDDQTRPVSLGGNQTQTIRISAIKGNPDGARFSVTTDTPVSAPAGYGTGYGSGYGSQPYGAVPQGSTYRY
jgi:hypothetical protein